MGKKHGFSIHHQLPSSRGGSSHDSNLVRLTNNVHISLHTVFSNLTPTEQVERLLSINCTSLSERFKNDIRKVLAKEPDYVYNNRVLIRK